MCAHSGRVQAEPGVSIAHVREVRWHLDSCPEDSGHTRVLGISTRCPSLHAGSSKTPLQAMSNWHWPTDSVIPVLATVPILHGFPDL